MSTLLRKPPKKIDQKKTFKKVRYFIMYDYSKIIYALDKIGASECKAKFENEISNAMNHLNDDEQIIIYYTYFKKKSQSEIYKLIPMAGKKTWLWEKKTSGALKFADHYSWEDLHVYKRYRHG